MPRPSRTGVHGLYRGDDGRYRIDLRWRCPDSGEPRRFRQTLPSDTPAAAAKERVRRVRAAALAGDFDPSGEAPKRLSALTEQYAIWCDTNRPKSVAARRSHLRVVGDHLGDPLLREITPEQVERMKREYLGGGRQPATCNRVLATFKHMVGMAINWDWLEPDHGRRLRSVRALKEPPGRVRYLTTEEREALLGCLADGLRPIVLTVLLTGLRLSEVLGLKVDDVDVSRGHLRLQETKNGRSRRVPIHSRLLPVLEERIAVAGNGLLFPSRAGKRRRSDSVSRSFKAAAVRAAIDDFTFHDLRHDFATNLRRSNVGLDVIAKLLGHQSLAMTQRYAHIDDPALREAVDSLSA